jgi:pyruvate carboxylase
MAIPFRRILAANRSEIAIRVFRAAAELGIGTVAIYAAEDKLSLHRFKADQAFMVGKGKGPLAAYLSIEDVIHTAKLAEVDAIHPGYGFLSENPEFAEACAAAGIVFIGPKPETMITARPGSLLPPAHIDECRDEAQKRCGRVIGMTT